MPAAANKQGRTVVQTDSMLFASVVLSAVASPPTLDLPVVASMLKLGAAKRVVVMVGAGISVYTAFFAFGAVRLLPELALTPGLWAIPLVTGLALIIYHQRAVMAPASRLHITS